MPTVSVTTAPMLAAGWLDAVPHAETIAYDGATARFRTARLGDALPALVNEIARRHADVIELHVQKSTLEDVLIELTAAAPSAT
jgi:hypothetical protein